MKKIKIIAPASYAPNLSATDIEKITRFFNNLNYNIDFGKHLLEKKYFFAGSDEQRLSDLENAFVDDQTDIVVILRGGTGCLRLLNKIDYKKIFKNQKPFFGFSDSTALQNALYTKTGMPSFSGFWALQATHPLPSLTKTTLLKCLQNKKQIFKVPFISQGKASGVLLGGNLRLFTSLLGTPYFPDMTNNILILEDIAEPPYKIDNMFTQLKLAGVFDKISGLILGDFSKTGTPKEQKLLNSFIKEYFKNSPYPVAKFTKYSHENGHVVIPFGGIVHLDSKKGIITLDKLKKLG